MARTASGSRSYTASSRMKARIWGTSAGVAGRRVRLDIEVVGWSSGQMAGG